MGDTKPVVANVCLDFLKGDMHHVYRQITGLTGFEPVVLARKRENADEFPFPEKKIVLLRRPRTRELRRFWNKTVRRRPVELNLGEVKDLLYGVQRFGGDVVHIYFGHVAVQLLPFIRACPWPVVVSFHGADVGVETANPAYRDRLVEVLGRAAMVVARSVALVDDLRALGCSEDRLRLHRTGIPLERWPFWERAVPPAGNQWRLLQACRLIEKKGLPVTIAAFAQIVESHPEATLTIAGDGPLRGALEKQAAGLGVSGQVRFTGFLNQRDLRNLVYESHLCFHPSQTGADGNREGVPNSMLEAMASGMPVLATRHGGIPEAVEHGVGGFLVEERDSEGLARHALELMANQALYQRVSARARQAIVDRFERKAQTGILEGYYREAIGAHAETRQRRLAPPATN